MRRLVGLFVLASLIASAPIEAADDDAVRFRAQGLPDAASASVTAKAQRAVLREFMANHPNYVIEPFYMPAVTGGGQMDTGPLMAIAAGIPPHAIFVNFRQSSTYMSQGFLVPLEVLLARILSDDDRVREADASGRWLADPSDDEVDRALALIRERVPEPAWPVVYREDESGRYPGKHVWAIPDEALVMALLYRKDLFIDAGLDPDRPPRTWDELLVHAQALTNPSKQQYGMMVQGGPLLSWSLYTFVVSNGARAVAPSEDGRAWRAAYGTRGAAEAIHFAWRLVNEPFERDGRTIQGAARVGTSELQLLWDQGRVGMRFEYLSDQVIEKANPQLIGIAPVPLSPQGYRGSELNCRMLGVFSGTTPQQKLAVMRYLWFRTGEEAKRISTRVYVENGYGQFVDPHYLKRYGYERILQRVPEDWKTASIPPWIRASPSPTAATRRTSIST